MKVDGITGEEGGTTFEGVDHFGGDLLLNSEISQGLINNLSVPMFSPV